MTDTDLENLEKAKEALDKCDFRVAFNLLSPFAEKGNAMAQYFVGWMLENILNFTDLTRADELKKVEKLYKASAEQDYYFAQFGLARYYHKNWRVQHDYVLAYMWYSIATFWGSAEAEDGKREVAKLMSPEQIEEAEKKTKAYRIEWEKRNPVE